MAEYHMVSFDWQGFVPHLYYYQKASTDMKELDLGKLDINISHHSNCVGNWQDGKYKPCPEGNKVTQGNICQDCASSFLPDLSCTFEPRCDGELCANRFCQQEHAVYLAFHGEIAKVGMTTSRRINQRMIEQGCDAFSVLAKVDGRASARKLEGSLSEKLSLRQMIRELESLFCMTGELPIENIEARYAEIVDEVEKIGLHPEPLKMLDEYPLKTPLTSMPKPTRIEGRHKGKVIGIKGKFLIYQNGGLKAINLQKVPGRFITY